VGYIEAICISRKKGIVKKPVSSSRFIENRGIEGDAHAGKWHRQISLLSGESIELKVGDRLILNNKVLLEITQIGKECHNSCAIKVRTGDCIMPREGLFAKVVKGGSVKAGDSIKMINSAKIKLLKQSNYHKLKISKST
jgi:MOSC domain-containing protein YiiM